MAGPKADVILARLHGTKVEYTGVVAGMSGSPVYIDGKLVGAIAYRIGEFSKEPIAGITPAATMLEIDDMDKTPAPIWPRPAVRRAARSPAAPPVQASRRTKPTQSGYANLLEAHRHSAGFQRLQRGHPAHVRQETSPPPAWFR